MPSLPTLQQFNAPLYQPASMKLQGMGMQEQMKRTDIAQKQVDISGKRQAMEEQMFQINKRAKHVEMARGFLPNVSQSNYGDFVKWNKENGVPDVAFKSPEEVAAMKPEQFEQYKVGLDKKAEDGLKLTGILKEYYDANGHIPNAAEIKKWREDTAPDKKIDKVDKSEAEKNKKLESLKSDYMQQVGRGYSAERGTGQFIPDENKAAVAKKAYDSAMIIAQTYVDAGGKWEDLGLEDPAKTPEAKDGDFVTQLTETHPPSEYKGKSGTDTETGKKYKSDGKSWIEVKQ